MACPRLIDLERLAVRDDGHDCSEDVVVGQVEAKDERRAHHAPRTEMCPVPWQMEFCLVYAIGICDCDADATDFKPRWARHLE